MEVYSVSILGLKAPITYAKLSLKAYLLHNEGHLSAAV